MLIRSQDKEILINLDRITTIAKSKDNCIIVTESPMSRLDKILLVGKYSTREKALKVLDMIDEFHYQYINTQNPTHNEITLTVFQIPQDNEVR